MTCDKSCKKCQELAEDVYHLNTKCYQGCHHGMYLTNSVSDKFGHHFIEIYRDYNQCNLENEMKYTFPDDNTVISKEIINMADNLYYLYQDAKNKLAYKNEVLGDLYLIKYYCADKEYLKDDMKIFEIEEEKIKLVERYLRKLGIIYAPKRRAAQMLLRILLFKILQNMEILDEMRIKIEKTNKSKDFIIKIFTLKYLNEVIKYFKSLD